MDFSSIFSMLNTNKNNNFSNINNNHNIYPNCNIFEQKTDIENNTNNNNFLSSILPLLMNGQNINSNELIKKITGNNPLFSTLFSNLENKKEEKKETPKIDVSNLIKVE